MAALIFLGLMLSGCGQKGPLTLAPKAKAPPRAPTTAPRAVTSGTMSAIPPDPAASTARPWGSPPQ